jgi:hypothetical protein
MARLPCRNDSRAVAGFTVLTMGNDLCYNSRLLHLLYCCEHGTAVMPTTALEAGPDARYEVGRL